MLATEIIRSFLPAQHLWYVKAVRLTNWQQHLSCISFTFWILKGKRKINRGGWERVGRKQWKQDGSEKEYKEYRSIPPEHNMCQTTHGWLTVPLKYDKNRFQGLQNYVQHHRGTPSGWMIGEVKLRSGLLPHSVKLNCNWVQITQVDLTKGQGKYDSYTLLSFCIRLKEAHIYINLNIIYLLNKWSTILKNKS